MFLGKLLGIKSKKRPKVFCIGRNKTGTTSLEKALRDLGYRVGDQAKAELLIHHYAKRDFRPIIEYCNFAEAFQDIPFSLPYTYQILDYVFPKSKFVLSVRGNEDEWYDSLIRFHRKRLGVDGRISKTDLVNDTYRYKGFIWEVNRIVYNTPESDPYNEKILKRHYIKYNEDVIEYFRFKNNLLVINLSDENSYKKFCDFLEVEPVYDKFPWLNKSD